MKRMPKHYFHRRETETISRLAEFVVEAATEQEALAMIERHPDAYPSDRPGSATMSKVIDRKLGPLQSGRNDGDEGKQENTA